MPMSSSARLRKESEMGRLEGGRRILKGARSSRPLVSIVSVVFQDGSELESLLQSIFSRSGNHPADRDVEVIVIDGGSKDGTVKVLKAWDERIDYWLSEKDSGIYDAMNKGIAAATGDYIFHLNAGDELRQIPTARLLQCRSEGIDVACFNVLTDGRQIYRPRTGFILRLDNSWHHQGTFYRRTSHPGYDTRYRVFGDFDANQKMYLRGCKVAIFPETVSSFSTGGVSSQSRRKEIYQIIRNNVGWMYLPIAWTRFQLNDLRHAVHPRWAALFGA
jgi:glycosyltransferase involved in cell wall biosynthesis